MSKKDKIIISLGFIIILLYLNDAINKINHLDKKISCFIETKNEGKQYGKEKNN